MNKKKAIQYAATIGIFLFLINLFAMRFHTYYIFWWFDMPMHFFGGLFVFFIYAGFIQKNTKSIWTEFLLAFLFIFAIGALWEGFEFFVQHHFLLIQNTLPDTLSDICFDMAGGLLGFISYNRGRYASDERKI